MGRLSWPSSASLFMFCLWLCFGSCIKKKEKKTKWQKQSTQGNSFCFVLFLSNPCLHDMTHTTTTPSRTTPRSFVLCACFCFFFCLSHAKGWSFSMFCPIASLCSSSECRGQRGEETRGKGRVAWLVRHWPVITVDWDKQSHQHQQLGLGARFWFQERGFFFLVVWVVDDIDRTKEEKGSIVHLPRNSNSSFVEARKEFLSLLSCCLTLSCSPNSSYEQ